METDTLYCVVYDNLEDDYSIFHASRKLDRYEFVIYGPETYDNCVSFWAENCLPQYKDEYAGE